jgi:glutamine synthetase
MAGSRHAGKRDHYPMSFAQRHGLLTAERREQQRQLQEAVSASGVQWLRMVLVDQHGLPRCKTLHVNQLPGALANGVRMVNTLLLKDTACKTAWPVFSAGAGMNDARFEGAGDLVLVPDPSSFRRLPWQPDTGWLLCTAYLADGSVCPFDTREILRGQLQRLSQRGWRYVSGLEVEFHVFRLLDPKLAPEDIAWPAPAPEVAHLEVGYQMLSEQRADLVEQTLKPLSNALLQMGLPLISVEAELGPSQCELVFDAQTGLASADAMILLRTAAKQIMRRAGLHASFMCKPHLPEMMASGWHLHQSLANSEGDNLFMPEVASAGSSIAGVLSALGGGFLAGLLHHTPACAAMATPTINGYQRYARAAALAPNHAVWGIDNRGALLRVIGGPQDRASRIENRIGEPAANPYLYLASQIAAGLDGIDQHLPLPPANRDPYAAGAGLESSSTVPVVPLPKSLAESLAALEQNAMLRSAFGDQVIDWFVRIKRHELSRYDGTAAWEQREYFGHY